MVKDFVANHVNAPGVDAARLPQVEDRTDSEKNRHLYYSENFQPIAHQLSTNLVRGDRRDDVDFVVL